MRLFKTLSIKNKIIGIVLTVTIFTIILGFSIVIISDIKTFKEDMKNSNVLNAKIIGDYCITPLLFKDEDGCNNVLSKLKTIPSVHYSFIYDEKNTLFASYKKTDQEIKPGAVKPGEHYEFEGDYLHIFQPIFYKNKKYGTIFLKVSTSDLNKKINGYLISMLIISIILIVLSYILTNRLQRSISRPVTKIADYFLNIAKGKIDIGEKIEQERIIEFKKLIDAINLMNTQLEKRINQLLTLQNISEKIILESNTGELYEKIHQNLNKYIGEINFIIGLYDKDLNQLSIEYLIDDGKKCPPKKHSLENGIYKWVIDKQESIFVRDTEKEELPEKQKPPGNTEKLARSIIILPLIVSSKVIGIISIQSYEPDKFNESHFQILSILASQVATSIENARIKDNLESLVEEATMEVKAANQRIIDQQEQLVLNARESGMMEMSSGIIHNIGNAINTMGLRLEGVVNLSKKGLNVPVLFMKNNILPIIEKQLNEKNLENYLLNDSKGKKIVPIFNEIMNKIEELHNNVNQDVTFIEKQVIHISEIISLQQNFIGSLGTEEFVNINAIIKDSLSIWKDSLKKRNISVEQNLNAKNSILSDKTQLAQIFINFIKNSTEAIEEKEELNGLISYTTNDIEYKGEPSIEIIARDNGCGIPETLIDKLFGFGISSKKKKKTGQGFGLYFCKKIVEKYSGIISIRSQEKEFTEIKIIFQKARRLDHEV